LEKKKGKKRFLRRGEWDKGKKNFPPWGGGKKDYAEGCGIMPRKGKEDLILRGEFSTKNGKGLG